MRNSAYLPLEHLRRSLFLGKNDFMPMLTVYCDDSGTHPESRIASVCGYISNTGQWELFTKEWMSVLKEFGGSSNA
jgi:hypothetical protein